jgi:hypothetical protein
VLAVRHNGALEECACAIAGATAEGALRQHEKPRLRLIEGVIGLTSG